MSSTNAFITELIRAANQIDRLSHTDARGLILRAVTMIREMRTRVGMANNGSYDTVFDLLKIASSPERHQLPEIARALLMAADMLRTLYLVVDSSPEITMTGITQSR
jgi:hypothetical protein